MAGVCKIILIGNLGRDPEMKYTQSQKAVTKFSLAVNEKWGGEDKTEWFNIVTFDRLAEIADTYLAKGSQVYIEGRLQTRTWEDDSGTKRYMTEVIANSLQMLDSRKDSNEAPAAKKAAPAAKKQKPPVDDNDPFGPPPNDDDLPF